jgi:hypothetical protein
MSAATDASSVPSEAVNLASNSWQALEQDLRWLEQHAVERGSSADDLLRLRLALALVMNYLVPLLAEKPRSIFNIAVVGGAGAGKSTIVNFLLGAAVAETNPQAGFTRHPIGYSLADHQDLRSPLPATSMLGRLKLLEQAQPGNYDADVYQLRPISPSAPSDGERLPANVCVWDCPDMTTWHAVTYTARLVEIIGLADLVVYVASDERYNDAVPTRFLRLILKAGKPVVACIVKVPAGSAAKVLEHFRSEVIARIPECVRVSACVAIPFLPQQVLVDPRGEAASACAPLLSAVRWWIERGAATSAEVARGGIEFLRKEESDLLALARRDLQALQDWQALVDKGQAEFSSRYRREYLSGEQFPRFQEALVRLLDLLELPGVGQVVSKTLWVIRTPYRLAKGFFNKMTALPARSAILPEEPVLQQAFTGWLDHFRKEVAVRDDHPVWRQIKSGFDDLFLREAQSTFKRCLAAFQVRQREEVERTARSIYEDLEKKPAALNALRGLKATFEVGTIVGTVVTLGTHIWLDVALVPVVAALTQELIERLGQGYVDQQREAARQRQQELFDELLARPLAEWLATWPTTRCSTLVRLKEVVVRVPKLLAELESAVRLCIRQLELR